MDRSAYIIQLQNGETVREGEVWAPSLEAANRAAEQSRERIESATGLKTEVIEVRHDPEKVWSE